MTGLRLWKAVAAFLFANAVWALNGCVLLEGEVVSNNFDNYSQAKAAMADDWLPRFLPEDSAFIREAHSIDTNEKCASFVVREGDLSSFAKIAAQDGYEHYVGELPAPAQFLQSECPFGMEELRSADVRLKKLPPVGYAESYFIAIDRTKRQVYWWNSIEVGGVAKPTPQ